MATADKKAKLQEIAQKSIEVDAAGFDYKSYVNNYAGVTKARRLVFIAERVPSIAVACYQAAIDYLKRGASTGIYTEICTKGRAQCGDALGGEYDVDQNWIQNVNRQGQETKVRLETAIATVKRDEEKEPIRAALQRLGDHLFERGDFFGANTQYLECKIFLASNSLNDLKNCLNIVRASVHGGTFSHVNAHVMRARGAAEYKTQEAIASELTVCQGLLLLRDAQFHAAADQFLNVTHHFCNEGAQKAEIISLADVATMGTLCALATFNRSDLKTRVMQNMPFRRVMEAAPQWRQILEDFYNCNYAACFDAIEKQKSGMLLDVYLSKHVRRLIATVRDRALIQYFRPFISVNIAEMAKAFNSDPILIEKQLAALIAEDRIQARIDSANKVVYARNADARSATFQNALSMGRKYVRDVKTLLLRMSLAEHDFVVMHPEMIKRKLQMEAMEREREMRDSKR